MIEPTTALELQPMPSAAQTFDLSATISTPGDLLRIAVQRGAGIDQLERLMVMKERFDANEARKAFFEARAAFKREVIVVEKDMENTQFGSRYSSLGNLVLTVTPFLAKHGLTVTFDQDQSSGLTVIATMAHSAGHAESTSLKVPPDTTGQKNPIQQIRSSITYAKSLTFESITGISATNADLDDDGEGFTDRKFDQRRQQWLHDQEQNIKEASSIGHLRKIMDYALNTAKVEKDTDAETALIGWRDAKLATISATNKANKGATK